MKRFPSVCIAILVYNTNPNMLQTCLNSVLGQDYNNFKVLVIDDHSTSCETLSILELYGKNKKISIIRNPTNLGIHKSRTLAIELASSDYFSFVDHDDVIPPNYISILVDACCQCKNNNTIAKGRYFVFKERWEFKKTEKIRTTVYTKNEAIERLLLDNMSPVWASMFPLATLKGIVCDPKYGMDDVQCTYYAFLRCTNVVFVHVDIYAYRYTINSGMKNNAFLKQCLKTFEIWLEYSKTQNLKVTEFLEYRVALGKIKCLIVEHYNDMKWKDFKQLISKERRIITERYFRVQKYLSIKNKLHLLLFVLFERIYCREYFKHRVKNYRALEKRD